MEDSLRELAGYRMNRVKEMLSAVEEKGCDTAIGRCKNIFKNGRKIFGCVVKVVKEC